MMLIRHRVLFAALGCGMIVAPIASLRAQQQDNPPASAQADSSQDSGAADQQGQDFDPLKRKLSDREKWKEQKEVRQELSDTYKKWLNQDVVYIISDQERKAFMNLSNNEERDAFIENFWQRRNPNPDSPENEFREEHYRRIAYANEHFAAGKPGWMTDRGRIYIAWGAPDSIDSHPSGGMALRLVHARELQHVKVQNIEQTVHGLETEPAFAVEEIGEVRLLEPRFVR